MSSYKKRYLEVLYLSRLKKLIDEALISNKINLGVSLLNFKSELTDTDLSYM